MKEEKQNTEQSKGFSRREFLKDAGLVAGVASIGAVSLVSACSEKTTTVTQTDTRMSTSTALSTATVTTPVTTTIVPPPTVTVLATTPKSGYIKWDAEKCVSCSRCQQACSTIHEGGTAPNLSAIRWFESKWFDGWDGEVPAYPIFCQHCTAPSCYAVCPAKDKALCIDPKTGARYINKEFCIGCGICAMGCTLNPARVVMDPVQNKAIKCDLCRDRTHRQVAELTLTNPGSGYTSPPTVSITGGGGTGATGFARTTAAIASIAVIFGGYNYTSVPNVTINNGGAGRGATATATVTDGKVTAITLTNPGSGYDQHPTIGFSGGGGYGAVARATMGAGPITKLLVAWPGSGYTSNPTVTITGGGGSGATGTAKISTGQTCVDVCHRGALTFVSAQERI